MNRNHAVLLAIAIITLPMTSFFIPDGQSGSLRSLEGITLSTLSGQQFRLSGNFLEKPTLLVFWSVTCSSCIEEVDQEKEIENAIRSKLPSG